MRKIAQTMGIWTETSPKKIKKWQVCEKMFWHLSLGKWYCNCKYGWVLYWVLMLILSVDEEVEKLWNR